VAVPHRRAGDGGVVSVVRSEKRHSRIDERSRRYTIRYVHGVIHRAALQVGSITHVVVVNYYLLCCCQLLLGMLLSIITSYAVRYVHGVIHHAALQGRLITSQSLLSILTCPAFPTKLSTLFSFIPSVDEDA
jgi:urease beta subunit